MKRSIRVLAILFAIQACFGLSVAWAQEVDSMRTYRMAEIVVGETATRRAEPAAVRRIPLAEIARSDASSVASIARLLPAAHVQTNSRGETLLYLRGAGERQVAVFLDGALLNVPWDNRVDLAFVPSGILGSVGVAHGTSSVLYGTNTVGGVLMMNSRTLERSGRLTEAAVSAGSAGWKRIEGMHLVKRGARSLLFGAGYSSQGSQPRPAGAVLPFEPPSPDRVNSDRRLAHAFVRGGWEGGSVSILHSDGRQGVAPEGHLDPAQEEVRYWRYPWWRMTLASLSIQRDPGPDRHLRAAVWASRFAQRIDQYDSVTFSALEARQDDEDLTAGGRISYDRPFASGTLVVAATGYGSRHSQADTGFDSGGGGSSRDPLQEYSQLVWSLGSEYRTEISSAVRGTAGIGIEGISTPKTGDKPPRGGQTSWTGSLGGVADLSHEWSVRLAAGRKLRFPTPRELFGTALGSFLVDSGLRPESAWSLDLGALRVFEGGEIETTIFYRRTFDTIDQENVQVGGTRLRRRINLDGASALGLEIAGRLEATEGLEIEGHVTAMRGRVIGVPGRTRPVEKPGLLGTTVATWRFRRGMEISVQGTYTGMAWGLGLENEPIALPNALVMDVRLAWRRAIPGTGMFAEWSVRVDNLFDELVMPQLGLPSPGRSGKAGLSLSF